MEGEPAKNKLVQPSWIYGSKRGAQACQKEGTFRSAEKVGLSFKGDILQKEKGL